MTKNRILAALLAAVLALSLTACGGADETPEEEPANPGVAVQVQEIGADTIYTENTVSGQLLAEDQSTIMVAVSAKCTAVYAEAGDEVKAGDMLCTLDLGSTLASHNAASISYRSSAQSYNDQSAVFEKQIALAEKNVRDLKELYEIGAASQMEIDQAERSSRGLPAGDRSGGAPAPKRHCPAELHPLPAGGGDAERPFQRGAAGHGAGECGRPG